jgi:hypothetical protein
MQSVLLVLSLVRTGIVKVEGGYHGSYDPLTVSCKPTLAQAGDAENPNAVIDPATVVGDVLLFLITMQKLSSAHLLNTKTRLLALS